MGDRAMSVRKATATALDRIQSLEDMFPNLVQGVNQTFKQMNDQIMGLTETAEALAALFGEDQVKGKVQEIRLKKDNDRAEAQKTALIEAVKGGQFTAAEVITEKSLIVGTEFDKEGVAIGAGRIQMFMAGVKPEFKEKLLGGKVGLSFDLPTGKFVVNEIYEAVEKPIPPPPVADTAAPAAAPATAPTAPACDGDCANCPGHDVVAPVVDKPE